MKNDKHEVWVKIKGYAEPKRVLPAVEKKTAEAYKAGREEIARKRARGPYGEPVRHHYYVKAV